MAIKTKINKQAIIACLVIAFLAVTIAAATPAKAQTLSLQPFTLTITGATGTVTITNNNILNLPSTTGVGGWSGKHGAVTGTWVGVPLQYLCNLVGGVSSASTCEVTVAQTIPNAYSTTYSQSLTLSQVNSIGTDSKYSWYTSSGASATAPTTETLIVAYEYNGAAIPLNSQDAWGPLRLVAVGPLGLLSSGSLSVSCVDTISIGPYPANYNALTYSTCNTNGAAQSTFNQGSNICFTATGLNPSTSYSVQVVPYQSAWTTGMAIPTAVSGSVITTNSAGNIAITSIYTSAAPGQYDIIVKPTSETDGTYDSQDLLITNVVATPGSGLFVLPEYAFGALGALGACFAVLISYAAVKKGVSFPHFSKYIHA